MVHWRALVTASLCVTGGSMSPHAPVSSACPLSVSAEHHDTTHIGVLSGGKGGGGGGGGDDGVSGAGGTTTYAYVAGAAAAAAAAVDNGGSKEIHSGRGIKTYESKTYEMKAYDKEDAWSDALLHKHVLTGDSMARCLDGSPAVYYHRLGRGDGVNKWMLWYEGGGWCYDLQDCYRRSLTEMGSSTTYEDVMRKDEDQFSSLKENNPTLYNWNLVLIKYCDGGYYSGAREPPQRVNARDLYFRGKYIQEAVVRDVFETRGFKNATDLLVAGCSAGAVQVFMNVDWVGDLVMNATGNPKLRVMGMPNSGWLHEYDGPGSCEYKRNMRSVYDMMNVTAVAAQRCKDKLGPDNEWRCMFFAAHLVPYIKTPLFVLQSRFDEWQVEWIYCNPKDVNGVNAFGEHFTRAFENATEPYAQRIGYLLDSCCHHCGGWRNVQSDEGITQQQAFSEWYEALVQASASTTQDASSTHTHRRTHTQHTHTHSTHTDKDVFDAFVSASGESEGVEGTTTTPPSSNAEGRPPMPVFHHVNRGPYKCASCCNNGRQLRGLTEQTDGGVQALPALIKGHLEGPALRHLQQQQR